MAGRLSEEGTPIEGGTRTYRVDRVVRAGVLPDVPARVPEDFSVADWKRLPFQMGAPVGTATFAVPPEREKDVRQAAGGCGRFFSRGGETVWEVEMSSAADVASWAAAEGVVPIGPPELVGAWRSVLEGVLEDAS